MKLVPGMISVPVLSSSKRAVRLNEALFRSTDRTSGWTKSPDLEKHCGRMMLLTVLLKSLNFGKSGNRCKQINKIT